MGQALYRKHRPKSLSEVIGQEHITSTLRQALKTGRLSHAYLFTGPRGVGKTSVARILAHEVNGLPYSDDSSHLDIIEIDAASNRRIDEIRELREKVYIAPASAKYKVYIIDEVHMLTREAFNALLKTLEEPPAHVVFILATTDAHKLPETIISRTQRFSFKPVGKSELIGQLKQIAQQEEIKISDEALELLADHGEGSFRDSISLLDQAGNQADQVEPDDVRRLLGIPPTEAVSELLTLSAQNDTPRLMKHIAALYDQGYQAALIAKQLGRILRAKLAEGSAPEVAVLGLLSELIEVPRSMEPERFLEIAVLRYHSQIAHLQPRPDAAQAQLHGEGPRPTTPSPETSEDPAGSKAQPDKNTGSKPEPISGKAKNNHEQTDLAEAVWPDVLQALKQRHNTLYGVVRMASPDFSEPGTLQLAFAFAFHQKRLNENANRDKLAAIVQEITGRTVSIEVVHDPKAKPPKAAAPVTETPSNGSLTTISNIFGGAELLES